MDYDLTNQELEETLMEFQRRVLAERVPVKPPEPLKIDVSSSGFQFSPLLKPTKVESLDQSHESPALVLPETEFNLVDAGFQNVSNDWIQYAQFSGLQPNHYVAHPQFIRVPTTSWGILAPGVVPNSGTLNLLFDTSTWLPPQLPGFVSLSWHMQLHGALPTGPPGTYVITLNATMDIQDAVTGDFATLIAGTWPFTPGSPGTILYTHVANITI